MRLIQSRPSTQGCLSQRFVPSLAAELLLASGLNQTTGPLCVSLNVRWEETPALCSLELQAPERH